MTRKSWPLMGKSRTESHVMWNSAFFSPLVAYRYVYIHHRHLLTNLIESLQCHSKVHVFLQVQVFLKLGAIQDSEKTNSITTIIRKEMLHILYKDTRKQYGYEAWKNWFTYPMGGIHAGRTSQTVKRFKQRHLMFIVFILDIFLDISNHKIRYHWTKHH